MVGGGGIAAGRLVPKGSRTWILKWRWLAKTGTRSDIGPRTDAHDHPHEQVMSERTSEGSTERTNELMNERTHART